MADAIQRMEGRMREFEKRFAKLEKENCTLRARLDKHQKAPSHFEASKR